MKLTVKKHINPLSFNKTKFTIFDEDGHEKYTATGRGFRFDRTIIVQDNNGTEVAVIKQKHKKVLGFLSRADGFSVHINGSEMCHVFEKWKLIGFQDILINGLPYILNGVFPLEYTMTEGDKKLMIVSQKAISISDTYDLEVTNDNQEMLCISIALSIDAIDAAKP
jgi:uncharacterized protein YxjI